MNPLNAYLGRSVLVTGLVDQDDGSLKVYVGPRYRGTYVIVEDSDAQKDLRREWSYGGHLLLDPPPPPWAVMQDEAES